MYCDFLVRAYFPGALGGYISSELEKHSIGFDDAKIIEVRLSNPLFWSRVTATAAIN